MRSRRELHGIRNVKGDRVACSGREEKRGEIPGTGIEEGLKDGCHYCLSLDAQCVDEKSVPDSKISIAEGKGAAGPDLNPLEICIYGCYSSLIALCLIHPDSR